MIDAKAKAIEIKNGRAERQLIEISEALEFVDTALGGHKADFDGFAARVTRDLQMRYKIESAIDDVFREGADGWQWQRRFTGKAIRSAEAVCFWD